MFSRFLAKNVGSASSFRSHFQQINRVCRSKPLVTKLPGSPKSKSLAYTHSNVQCSFKVWVQALALIVLQVCICWGLCRPTCKTDFHKFMRNPVSNFWGGMVYPSPHHANSTENWRLEHKNGGGLASYVMFLCMDFGVVNHTFEEAAKQQCSPGEQKGERLH